MKNTIAIAALLGLASSVKVRTGVEEFAQEDNDFDWMKAAQDAAKKAQNFAHN